MFFVVVVLDIFAVKALPSAGIIPLLQMFCPNKTQNKHGFPIFPESKYVILQTNINYVSCCHIYW